MIELLHSEFPNVGKNIIQNEVRKNGENPECARNTVQSISESLAQADEILGEEQKMYIDSDSEDDQQKYCESDESYHSQDEKEEEEIDEICKPKVNNFVDSPMVDQEKSARESEELLGSVIDELSAEFQAVPKVCVEECVNTFYPNMGKIKLVLGEFEKQWVLYCQDFDNYKKGRKDRKERVKKTHDIDQEINPELAKETEELAEEIESSKKDMDKDTLKKMRKTLKSKKKQLRSERKEFKRKQKEERRLIKSQAKELKKAQKAIKKEEKKKLRAEKQAKRDEETKARSMKDYEDDVFFREVRQEPTILKQYLKEAKKNLKKATKAGNQEEIDQYTAKLEELEQQFEAETDKAIMLTYQRYNKPEEAASRLDLHGLRKKEAIKLLEKIVAIRTKQVEENHGPKEGRDAIEFNIVTGRGNHSGGRSVLKPAVKDWLLDNNFQYEEFSNGAGYKITL